MRAIFFEIGRGEKGKKITRQKSCECSNRSAFKTRHQIANKSYGNYNWPRRDHGNCHCVQELLLIQPMVFFHDTTIQEWNNSESTAKYKGACFEKVPSDLTEPFIRRNICCYLQKD